MLEPPPPSEPSPTPTLLDEPRECLLGAVQGRKGPGDAIQLHNRAHATPLYPTSGSLAVSLRPIPARERLF